LSLKPQLELSRYLSSSNWCGSSTYGPSIEFRAYLSEITAYLIRKLKSTVVIQLMEMWLVLMEGRCFLVV